MANSVSIIICCYNSALRLSDTLRYLANQEVDGIVWELIVVDNNSTDNTSEVAKTEWESFGNPVRLRVISEPQAGLSHARAAGIKHANYELLLFCDDDNWLEADYLKIACRLMADDQQIGILGGLNTPIATIELPIWFKTFEGAYACGPQAEVDGEVDASRLYITGAGMVVRREVLNSLDAIQFKSNLTDRKGEELSSGGDTELCFVTAMLGYKLVYSSALRLFHFIDPKRLTWDYLIRLEKGHAKSYYKLVFYKRLYEGGTITADWKQELKRWQHELVGRAGITLLYQACFRMKVGDRVNVYMKGRLEMLKAHLRMKAEYTDFIVELRRLHNAATAFARQHNK